LHSSFIANKVVIISNVAYQYCRRTDSADCSFLNINKLKNYFDSIKEILDFLNNNVNCFQDYKILFRSFFDQTFSLFHRIEKENFDFVVKQILEIERFVKKEYKHDVWENTGISVILWYAQNHSLEEVNRTNVWKTAFSEYIRNNVKK
jgi:hypothetical protein